MFNYFSLVLLGGTFFVINWYLCSRLVVLAGNPSPIEIMCHLPAVCEDKAIPYVYVPTGRDIGTAMGVKRCSLVVLIRKHEDFSDLYDEVVEEVKLLPIPPPIEM